MIFKTILHAIKGESTRRPSGRAATEPLLAENSFSYLATHPSISNWKRKLYSLIEGESDETLSRLGSIEQYVRVLLAESESADAKYCFSEALSQIVQEWTPTVVESADRLYNMLGVIAGFTPPVGFIKTLDYLNNCGSIKRSEEEVSSEYRPVDLYKKGLEALGRYYPTAPQYSQNDQGFISYTQLLMKNLQDPRYTGYAAGRLLELNLLDIRSDKISTLLLSNNDIFTQVFRRLLEATDEPEAMASIEARVGDLLVICARSDSLEKFQHVALSLGATFNPEGDYEVYFPTLTLSDGVLLNIYLNMDDIKDTALAYYIGYNKERLSELLFSATVEPDKIGKYVSGYLTQVISDPNAVEDLIKKLNSHKIHIVPHKNEFVLSSRKSTNLNNVPLKLDEKVLNRYLVLRSKSIVELDIEVRSRLNASATG